MVNLEEGHTDTLARASVLLNQENEISNSLLGVLLEINLASLLLLCCEASLNLFVDGIGFVVKVNYFDEGDTGLVFNLVDGLEKIKEVVAKE